MRTRIETTEKNETEQKKRIGEPIPTHPFHRVWICIFIYFGFPFVIYSESVASLVVSWFSYNTSVVTIEENEKRTNVEILLSDDSLETSYVL